MTLAALRGVAAALALVWGAAGAAGPVADEPAHETTTVKGDTVIGLARRLLADPRRWPELARANALANPNRVAVGTTLRVPLRLMRTDAVSAELLSVVGAASSSGGSALQAGQAVPEGGRIDTGADGHVTIRLVDGTLLRLRPDSRLQLRESRRIPDAQAVRSGARLDQGRVEIEAAPARAGKPGFTIDTPQGVLGVRGTEFRVATDGAQGATRGEVLGGVVAFDGGGPGQRVAAGFGSVIANGGRVAAPVRLLPAPDTTPLPPRQERLLMRFPLTPIAGATAYRGQIARDTAFDQVLADLTSATPELRFAELPDGDYVLRVRAIDGQGLEGRDSDFRFTLKARPEAPLPSAPAPKTVAFGSSVDFAWTANSQAQSYRLQLAATPDFKAPLRDLAGLKALATTLDGLLPGSYFWRLASVREVEGQPPDRGPWGDARNFELRPLPPAPKPPQVGDKAVAFAWEGAPGQSFEFEVASDAGFTQKVFVRKLGEPGIEVPLPLPGAATGRFYVRLRATDPDGFVGPYTTPQYFDIPNCVRDGSGLCLKVGSETLNFTP